MWLGICGSCAAGANRAARWAISWRRATRRGNNLRSYWCCWYCCCRGRCRWWWCWRCQGRWLQLDATWQCTAPLTCCQAGEQAGPLHAVARRATDLCLRAVVGAIRCADDGVVVVARQRVALHNCKRGGSRGQQENEQLSGYWDLCVAVTYSRNVVAVHSSARQSHRWAGRVRSSRIPRRRHISPGWGSQRCHWADHTSHGQCWRADRTRCLQRDKGIIRFQYRWVGTLILLGFVTCLYLHLQTGGNSL